MKLILFYLLFSGSLWARPLVLLGHFDAFGKASFNNSEKVAKLLYEKLKGHPDVDLRLCALQTVFDKSLYQLEDCLNALPKAPDLVLGLGESNCNFKVETLARNLDKTKGPDNDGIERNNTPIAPEGPKEIGLLYPLPEMYCSLSLKDRAEIEVSNHAGSFVCNNITYQFASRHPEQVFGFIHVPANYCKNLEQKTVTSVRNLETMILSAVQVKKVTRLSTHKKQLAPIRASVKEDKCLSEFYKRTKGVDEKGFLSF